MRIVSLNCWSGRVPCLVQGLVALDADIYCLQEVASAPPGTPEWLSFEGQGSTPEMQRSRLFEELTTALPAHRGFYIPAAMGYLHDGATTPYPAQYGIATFLRHSVPVIRSLSDFVFGKYRPDRWGDPPLPRPGHVLRVWNYEQNRPLVVAHMHGMWLPNGKADTPERVQQGNNLLRMIWDVRKSEDPVVVCGDFNVLPESGMLACLKNVAPIELVTSRGHTDTRTHFYKKPIRYADYMLVSRDIRVEGFAVPAEPALSDHRSLVLDISRYPAPPLS